MKSEVTRVLAARDLPPSWDDLTVDYFQTREFLEHTEKYNSCQQHYYVLCQDKTFHAGCVVYTLPIDLFTYLTISSPISMNILGIPCSVSASGIVGDPGHFPVLIQSMQSQEKGLILMLNLQSPLHLAHWVNGRTLPTIELKNRFESWDSYLGNLRADYKRRYLRLASSFQDVRIERSSCTRFDIDMYHLYCDVLKRSKGKLETLTFEFFQCLPDRFNLTAYYGLGHLLGWHISTQCRDKFYFFLGGINYQTNRQYNTYFNILYGVLREGIESGAAIIDLGQTAEIPKTRLGGEVVERWMCGYHSNWLLRNMLKTGKGLLEYSVRVPGTSVFKERS